LNPWSSNINKGSRAYSASKGRSNSIVFNPRGSVGCNTIANLTEYGTERENNTTIISSVPNNFHILNEINETDSPKVMYNITIETSHLIINTRSGPNSPKGNNSKVKLEGSLFLCKNDLC